MLTKEYTNLLKRNCDESCKGSDCNYMKVLLLPPFRRKKRYLFMNNSLSNAFIFKLTAFAITNIYNLLFAVFQQGLFVVFNMRNAQNVFLQLEEDVDKYIKFPFTFIINHFNEICPLSESNTILQIPNRIVSSSIHDARANRNNNIRTFYAEVSVTDNIIACDSVE